MTDSIITEAAVEAAKKAIREVFANYSGVDPDLLARAALAAALPHITDPRLAAAQARIAELEEALGEITDLCDNWREYPDSDAIYVGLSLLRRAREVLERKAPSHPARGTE